MNSSDSGYSYTKPPTRRKPYFALKFTLRAIVKVLKKESGDQLQLEADIKKSLLQLEADIKKSLRNLSGRSIRAKELNDALALIEGGGKIR